MKKKSWFKKALEYQEKGNFSQALVAIEEYLKQRPKDKVGKLLKAIIYGDLANYTLILEILEGIKPKSNDSKVYSRAYYKELADTYSKMGNFEEALKYYDKLIELFPEETPAYIFKGAFLAKTGNYELAKIEHLKATKLKGNPEEAYYNLALIARAEMKFEEAKLYCEKSLEIDSNDKSVQSCYKDILNAIKMKGKIEIEESHNNLLQVRDVRKTNKKI